MSSRGTISTMMSSRIELNYCDKIKNRFCIQVLRVSSWWVVVVVVVFVFFFNLNYPIIPWQVYHGLNPVDNPYCSLAYWDTSCDLPLSRYFRNSMVGGLQDWGLTFPHDCIAVFCAKFVQTSDMSFATVVPFLYTTFWQLWKYSFHLFQFHPI